MSVFWGLVRALLLFFVVLDVCRAIADFVAVLWLLDLALLWLRRDLGEMQSRV
jgi:hypothetical protein